VESSSIRQVQGFTGPGVGLDHNTALDMKDDSSPIECSKHIFTEFVVTLLVEESNIYCYYITFYKQLAACHRRASQVKR
jgi:hypothetical protein